MKSYFAIPILVLTVGQFFGGCVSSEEGKTVTRENGVEIVIQEKTSILPHGTGDEVLKLAGQSFHHLYSPGYIWIPEWSSILFLTHREGSEYRLHVFSLERKQDMTIKTDDLTFQGTEIGQPKANSMTCFVEKVDGDIAILIERGYKSPDSRYELDRTKKSLRPLR